MKITTFKRAIIAIAMMLVTAATSWAYDFSDNGIYYGKNSDGKTVYVTSGDNKYTGSVVIPLTVTDSGKTYSVTSIGYEAFYKCSGLTSVTIPNSVTWIGVKAFYNCSGLTSVTIPNSVTSIGEYAFSYCSGLTSVTIPNSVTSIGSYAFESCRGLTSVTIPNSVTSIGNLAFYNCSGLTSVVFNAENCTSMGSFDCPVFYGCSNLTSITIGENVKTIPGYAFLGRSGLTSVTIPNSVTSIGKSAFYNCSGLTKVEISDIAAWYKISFDDAFANPLYYAEHLYLNGKEVTNLVIPNTVSSIGNWAFLGCSGLTSVTIPNSVTEIGDGAFYGCFKILSFTSQNATPPTLPSERVFEGMPRSCQLYVPASSKVAYQTAIGWTFFTFVNAFGEGDIETIDWDSVSVTAAGGAIRVEGAEGAEAEVYSLSGALLYCGTDSTIALPRGIYIVKVAGTTTKVIL